jgi:hypothetical protein
VAAEAAAVAAFSKNLYVNSFFSLFSLSFLKKKFFLLKNSMQIREN